LIRDLDDQRGFNYVGDITAWVVMVSMPVERTPLRLDHKATTTGAVTWYRFACALCHAGTPKKLGDQNSREVVEKVDGTVT